MTYISLYFSNLEDGMQMGIGALCPDKSELNPVPSPEDSPANSDTEDSGLTTCGKFVSVNLSLFFIFLFCLDTNKNKILFQFVF